MGKKEGCGSIEREFTFRNFGDKQEADTPQKLFRHVFFLVFFFFMKSSFAVTIFCSTQHFTCLSSVENFSYLHSTSERGTNGISLATSWLTGKRENGKMFQICFNTNVQKCREEFCYFKGFCTWLTTMRAEVVHKQAQHGESSSKSHLIRYEI